MVGNPYKVSQISKIFYNKYKYKNKYSYSVNTLLVHGMFFRFKHQSDWIDNKMLYCYNNFKSRQEIMALYIYYRKNNSLRSGKNPANSFLLNVMWFDGDSANLVRDFVNGLTPFPIPRRIN